LQLADATGIIGTRQGNSPTADSWECQVTLGAPFPTPAVQKMWAHLILARDLPDRSSGIEGPHGGDFEIATVDSSGQIHFLAPFNVFAPLTCCLIFATHSNVR